MSRDKSWAFGGRTALKREITGPLCDPLKGSGVVYPGEARQKLL
jgi:hypothetical protein